jgi:drug/metabolite transporter (DMT)-like permease
LSSAEVEVAVPPSHPRTAQVLIAFATLYVVWGSTYFAIRVAVASWPPLLMASVRFATAGTILYAIQRRRGVPAPDRREWGAAAIVGLLLLGLGNGVVSWSEQWVPSGITALIVASVPLWMTLLPWVTRRGPAPRPAVLAGVAVGLTGVAVLLRVSGSGVAALWAPLALVGASLAWSVGSLWSRRLPLPRAPFMATAAEMLAAAPMLFAASVARGELGTASAASMLAPRALGALGYLVVFGSIAGFGAYVWLLANVSPTRASTYAFVNPLIAVFLGWALAAEPLTPRTFAATLLIVASVAAVVWGTALKRPHERAADAPPRGAPPPAAQRGGTGWPRRRSGR